MAAVLYIASCIVAPALVLWLCQRLTWARKIGAVILCYVVGIAFGNSGLVPSSLAPVLTRVADVAVALALPLLLFSSDPRRWVRTTGRALLSFALVCVAVAVMTLLGFLGLRLFHPGAWKLAGMAMGVYTGGTPNLAAIKSALAVDTDTFVVFHTYDTVASLAYIFFMVSIAQRLLLRFLPAYRPAEVASDSRGLETESLSAYAGLLDPRRLPRLGLALLVAAAILPLATLAGRAAGADYGTAVGVLTITTLGVAGSLVPVLHRIERTFQLGFYVILVFCVAVGSMARLDALARVQWPLFGFIVLVIYGSLVLHVLLCRPFRIDADTCIVTHVSGICSPPFVPPVVAGLRNPELLPVGITTGIIGYAVGNYLGIGLAYLFRSLP